MKKGDKIEVVVKMVKIDETTAYSKDGLPYLSHKHRIYYMTDDNGNTYVFESKEGMYVAEENEVFKMRATVKMVTEFTNHKLWIDVIRCRNANKYKH